MDLLKNDSDIYKVQLLYVHDGDTFTGKIILLPHNNFGIDLKLIATFRLEGLNAPEIIGQEKEKGIASKKYLEDRLVNAKEILVKTKTKEKYGRWLAIIFCDKININQELLEKGYALPMKG